MRKKYKETVTFLIAKNPARAILCGIILLNVVLLVIAALLISALSPDSLKYNGFFESIFYTISMIFDAGCIQYVVADIGQVNVILIIVCLITIFIGMITFTGAMIGYITNYISNFIESSNSGNRPLKAYGHTVILNWNTRASEIVNDLLYSPQKEKVVILVNSRKAEIEKEILERLEGTILKENKLIWDYYKDKGYFQKRFAYFSHKFKNNVTFIIREGDIFSTKNLSDISLEYAKAVIILGNDNNNSLCKYEQTEFSNESKKGNAQLVKTLMQVADITAADYSMDDQKIIVEIMDDWTAELVDKIIKAKQVSGKCNIVPVRVNKILGQLLSQFSLMPELNLVYSELLSNRGAAFYSLPDQMGDDISFVKNYLQGHKHAIPLTFMSGKEGVYSYYTAGSESDIHKQSEVKTDNYCVDINRDYWIEKKNVIIMGHNSKSHDIMNGFAAFRNEWNYKDGSDEILRIIVIDDEKNLEKYDYYKDYPFVIKTVAANIFEKEIIYKTIKDFVIEHKEDTSILILSDDSVPQENIDANALASLVYVQDIINEKAKDKDFDKESIDVIIEIIDPKHYDVVNSYSVNNVVISNRYISKMMTQIGEKEALFDFYTDILTYDTADSVTYESKEIYAKKVSRFFNKIPDKCNAETFIRAVFDTTIDPTIDPDNQNPAIVLGYVKPGGEMILFEGDQSKIEVEIGEKDKLIVFSNH